MLHISILNVFLQDDNISLPEIAKHLLFTVQVQAALHPKQQVFIQKMQRFITILKNLGKYLPHQLFQLTVVKKISTYLLNAVAYKNSVVRIKCGFCCTTDKTSWYGIKSVL